MSNRPVQEHPSYHIGFFDAMEDIPIFEDECSPEYAAGWKAYWVVKDILNEPDFLERTQSSYLPADGFHPVVN